jgi:hypothetical protein
MRILALLGCCGVLLAGCFPAIAPFPEYADAWIGKPVDRLVAATERPGSYASRSHSQARFYQLANGNGAYAAAEREGCIVHWEFNRERVIVAYKTEGEKCR